MKINNEKPRDKKHRLSTVVSLGTALLVSGSDLPKLENRVEMKDRAKQELVMKGITSEQKKTYVLGINDLLYKFISPRGYTANSYAPRGTRVADEIVDKKPVQVTLAIVNRIIDGLKRERIIENNEREDAWRMYLGKPQVHNTFAVSDYFPTRSMDNKYYYKFNNPLFLFRSSIDSKEEQLKRIIYTLETSRDLFIEGNDSVVLNGFQWSKGKDERGCYLAYYDKWDLNVPVERNGFFGNPLEVYGRIYYDPETFEILSF